MLESPNHTESDVGYNNEKCQNRLDPKENEPIRPLPKSIKFRTIRSQRFIGYPAMKQTKRNEKTKQRGKGERKLADIRA